MELSAVEATLGRRRLLKARTVKGNGTAGAAVSALACYLLKRPRCRAYRGSNPIIS